ncbi:MAG: copper ion binding protein [Oscillospiraceae bacterium]|jgi:copper chaperone|nr:copper ion binding protein [Oscillospiraceae bacterium]
MEKITLKIEGMSCGHCVKAVTDALAALAGVSDIAVSLEGKSAAFSYDAAAVSLDAVRAAIEEEGYDVVA